MRLVFEQSHHRNYPAAGDVEMGRNLRVNQRRQYGRWLTRSLHISTALDLYPTMRSEADL